MEMPQAAATGGTQELLAETLVETPFNGKLSLADGIERIQCPEPTIGGKSYVTDHFGKLLLEEGPGVLRVVCCPHAGSGYVNFWDSVVGHHMTDKAIFRMHPVILGAWMLDAGFNNGLLVELAGSRLSSPPCMTIVWLKKK